jgi:F-type H+-transporting ATPase subunit b
MRNFDQIFTLLAENKGISLNLDILETGILNIIVLIGILVYVSRDLVGSALEKRKKDIIESIQDAEERLNEANRRLSEAKKEFVQVNIVIAEIENKTLATKNILLKFEIDQSKNDLTARFSKALASFSTKERQIFLELKQVIILSVFKRIVTRAKETFTKRKRANALINETINNLEEGFL